MNKNKRIINVGLILIGLTLLLSIFTTLFLRIKEPVFLNHYYEYNMYLQNENNLFYSVGSGRPIILQYITNASDDKNVIGVSFKEAPYLYINASEYESNNFYWSMSYSSSKDNILGTSIGTYSLRNIYLTIDVPIESASDQLELSEAIIYFNNGEQMEVNIGKLILYKEEPPLRDYFSLDRSSSSSTGESNISFKLLDDIRIKSIDSPLLDKLNNYMNLKVNSNEYTTVIGKEYKRDDTLLISNTLNSKVRSDFPFTRFEISPKLYYQNSQGNTYYERLYIIENNYYDNPSFLDIIKHVKLNR